MIQPSLEPEAKILLTSLLENSKIFLEYGAGGSTHLAARMGVHRIISVESDALFQGKFLKIIKN